MQLTTTLGDIVEAVKDYTDNGEYDEEERFARMDQAFGDWVDKAYPLLDELVVAYQERLGITDEPASKPTQQPLTSAADWGVKVGGWRLPFVTLQPLAYAAHQTPDATDRPSGQSPPACACHMQTSHYRRVVKSPSAYSRNSRPMLGRTQRQPGCRGPLIRLATSRGSVNCFPSCRASARRAKSRPSGIQSNCPRPVSADTRYVVALATGRTSHLEQRGGQADLAIGLADRVRQGDGNLRLGKAPADAYDRPAARRDGIRAGAIARFPARGSLESTYAPE